MRGSGSWQWGACLLRNRTVNYRIALRVMFVPVYAISKEGRQCERLFRPSRARSHPAPTIGRPFLICRPRNEAPQQIGQLPAAMGRCGICLFCVTLPLRLLRSKLMYVDGRKLNPLVRYEHH